MTLNMASILNIEQFTIYDNILPIYERFCRKLNQYSFLTDFRLAYNLQSENQQLRSRRRY